MKLVSCDCKLQHYLFWPRSCAFAMLLPFLGAKMSHDSAMLNSIGSQTNSQLLLQNLKLEERSWFSVTYYLLELLLILLAPCWQGAID